MHQNMLIAWLISFSILGANDTVTEVLSYLNNLISISELYLETSINLESHFNKSFTADIVSANQYRATALNIRDRLIVARGNVTDLRVSLNLTEGSIQPIISRDGGLRADMMLMDEQYSTIQTNLSTVTSDTDRLEVRLISTPFYT